MLKKNKCSPSLVALLTFKRPITSSSPLRVRRPTPNLKRIYILLSPFLLSSASPDRKLVCLLSTVPPLAGRFLSPVSEHGFSLIANRLWPMYLVVRVLYLVAQCINAGDVKNYKIHTCNGLMMHTKKNLTGIKSLSGAKVEKICEAAEKIVNFGYMTGSDALLKEVELKPQPSQRLLGNSGEPMKQDLAGHKSYVRIHREMQTVANQSHTPQDHPYQPGSTQA